MPRLQHGWSVIQLTQHAKELECSGFVKLQAGRHLQEHRSAFFSKRACLLQKAFQRFLAIKTQFAFMRNCPRSFYRKAKILGN